MSNILLVYNNWHTLLCSTLNDIKSTQYFITTLYKHLVLSSVINWIAYGEKNISKQNTTQKSNKRAIWTILAQQKQDELRQYGMERRPCSPVERNTCKTWLVKLWLKKFSNRDSNTGFLEKRYRPIARIYIYIKKTG